MRFATTTRTQASASIGVLFAAVLVAAWRTAQVASAASGKTYAQYWPKSTGGAASESRSAYLARLQVTQRSNGVSY